jgi:glycosyltransferase involved in cell wall biosynthesis
LIPLISVLVPTRNRASYLSSLISIIEKCPDARIEFLVSDNSDQLGVTPSSVGNVTYLRPERVLNMTDHWNYLFNKASGKYVTFVGDDDAFIPSALVDLCDTLEHTDPDLVWTETAGYGWPTPGIDGNFFQRIKLKNERISLENAREQILKLESLDLPIPYNKALVKRKVILHFLENHPGENFFSSRVPDVNAGVKVLFLSESQFVFNELTFISGASPMSNGLLTRTNQNHPVTLEFNNPEFNPLTARSDSQIKEISPFGFVTYFEAIEESLLQLGEKLLCSPTKVAFRSVFESSFPKQQLEISMKLWKKHSLFLKYAYFLTQISTLKFVSYLIETLKRVNMGLKVLLRREKFLIIRGPGINDTCALVAYLERNGTILERKFIAKIFLQ